VCSKTADFAGLLLVVSWLVGLLLWAEPQRWLSVFPLSLLFFLLASLSLWFSAMPFLATITTPSLTTTTLALLLTTTEMLSPNQSSSLMARGQGGSLPTRGSLGGGTLASQMAQLCMYLNTFFCFFTFLLCILENGKWVLLILGVKLEMQVDLVGGYYDAGDNVKFGFPMAFTTTMLSWSVIEFGGLMKGELQNAKDAIRWATDYLLKATAHPDTIYVQVCSLYSVFSHICLFCVSSNGFFGVLSAALGIFGRWVMLTRTMLVGRDLKTWIHQGMCSR
jgi:hypothetical protein